MRKLTILIALAAASSPAFAGGMGDTAYHTRQQNAYCDMQRRGEIPRSPDLCLPELPPDYVPAGGMHGPRY